MKNIPLYLLIILALNLSCKDLDEISFIEIKNLKKSELKVNSVTVEADILGLTEGDVLNQHGFVYFTTKDEPTKDEPTIQDEIYSIGIRSTDGNFKETISGLQINNSYRIRAFAELGNQIVYSDEIIDVELPRIDVQFSQLSIEKLSGKVIFRDTIKGLTALKNITSHGFIWSTENGDPKIETNDNVIFEGPVDAEEIIIESELKQLVALDTYYVRSFIISDNSRIYGEKVSSFIKGDIWQNEQEIQQELPRNSKFPFVINEEVYFYIDANNFGKLNPTTQKWKYLRSPPIPGNLVNASSFSIGDKGYLVGGKINNFFNEEIWEYNSSTNKWNEKASPPEGLLRELGTGFSLGNKGYYGLGFQKNDVRSSDIWEYDPEKDSWIKTYNYPGQTGKFHIAFPLIDKVCVGLVFTHQTTDFYCFTPNEGWYEASKFPLPIINFRLYGSFSIENSGFFYIPNTTNNFWEFDSDAGKKGKWIQRLDFPGGALNEPTAFAVGVKGYLGHGSDLVDFSSYNEVWHYTPETEN